MKDKSSITLSNLETGELLSTDYKFGDDRHIQRGYKMYNSGVEYLIMNLSKQELLTTMRLYDKTSIDKFNMLAKPFNKLTPDLSTVARSKLKRKLLDLGVLGEVNKKLMLNPYTFIPKGTKDIRNCNWLTQRAWKYLFEDASIGTEDVVEHAELITGTRLGPTSTHMLVGSGRFERKIKKKIN